MSDVVRKVYRAEIREIDTEKFTLEAVVSDETVDRYNEVILASAWAKGVKPYKKHPVLLSSHNYHNLTSQIGKAEKIWVEDDKLLAKFQYFVGEGNEQADWGFKLAEKGLAAFSVGFIAKEYTSDELEIEELLGTKKRPRAVFKDVELLEISQVLVPANPSALARSLEYEDDPIVKSLLEEGKDLVEKWTKPLEVVSLTSEGGLDSKLEQIKILLSDFEERLSVRLTEIEAKLSVPQKEEKDTYLDSIMNELKNFEVTLNKTSV